VDEPDTIRLALPTGGDDRARAWLDAGSPVGSAPRPAASVCLLRDADGGPQVLWITRSAGLAVAPGQLAFPGGAVEADDRRRRHDDLAVPDRFTVLARAAVRELAEETGHRVDAPTLVPLVRWVTPAHEPRRYDSTFLVGPLQDHDEPDHVPAGGEVHEHGWATPETLLQEVAAGARVALPPTRAVLTRLARACAGADLTRALAVLRAGAVLVPVVPRATWDEGGRTAGPDGARGVDLLLPRHAGEMP